MDKLFKEAMKFVPETEIACLQVMKKLIKDRDLLINFISN